MVVSCAAFNCFETWKQGGPVTFHCFPKDERRRKLWEIKVRRENFKATDWTKLCSRHFTPDCFDTLKFGGTWLKKTAVPTIFDFPCHVIRSKNTYEPPVLEAVEPEPEPVIELVPRKRKHYIGDFDDDDMDSPEEARRLLAMAKTQKKNSHQKIRTLQQKIKRMEKEILTLKMMLKNQSVIQKPIQKIIHIPIQKTESHVKKSVFL